MTEARKHLKQFRHILIYKDTPTKDGVLVWFFAKPLVFATRDLW